MVPHAEAHLRQLHSRPKRAMRIHLTELAVKKLKPAKAAYWDKTTPGFGLRVGKHARTWVVIRANRESARSNQVCPDLSLPHRKVQPKRKNFSSPRPSRKQKRFIRKRGGNFSTRTIASVRYARRRKLPAERIGEGSSEAAEEHCIERVMWCSRFPASYRHARGTEFRVTEFSPACRIHDADHSPIATGVRT